MSQNLIDSKYGYRAINFLDDNFTLNSKKVTQLCERMIKRGWDLLWYAFSRVDSIVRNEKMVHLMKKAGLDQVFVGFESGSQEVLNKLGKKVTVEKAFKAMVGLPFLYELFWGYKKCRKVPLIKVNRDWAPRESHV
jgi:radical SAM superfamily enzyme YgiQ (UPF0313 family)